MKTLIKGWLAALLILLPQLAAAQETPFRFFPAFVNSVYDGDTARVSINLNFGLVLVNQPLRFYGIDTPEIRGPEKIQGIIARDFVRRMMPVGSMVIVEILPDKSGLARTGKFGRWLAIIHVDGVNLNDLLIERGMAKPYLID